MTTQGVNRRDMMDEKKHEKKFVLSDAVIADLVFLAFFLVIAIVAVNYNPRARSIPMALGVIGSIMMIFQTLADAIPGLRAKLGFVVQSGILADDKTSDPKDKKDPPESAQISLKKVKPLVYWGRVLRLVLWLVGFILLFQLLIFTELPSGYLIAVGSFIVLMTKFEAKESWKKAILLAVCVNTCFFILFDILLQAHL